MMPDKEPSHPEAAEEVLVELRLRTEALERKLAEVKQAAQTRLIQSELKAEALRAGIADPDGLKLIDLSAVQLNDDGEVENAATVISGLKQAKPWLFPLQTRSSSTAVPVPPPQVPKSKLATEMSEDEWRSARATLLKRQL